LFAACLALLFFSVPRLSAEMKSSISAAMRAELPELVRGRTGYVQSGQTRTWYESIDPEGPSKGAMLLFMGISMDALGWPQGFIERLVGAGYQVIRFDYRGTGLSDWKNKPYTLADLAADGIAILDALGVRRAHLVGLSMGGLVVQEFVLHAPERALALLMSSGNLVDPELPKISRKVGHALFGAGIIYGTIPSERNLIRMHVATRMILRGQATYPIDAGRTALPVLYNLRQRRGYNRFAFQQHRAALMRSGARGDQLGKVKQPALVVHGVADPLIPIAHGRKLASLLPRAEARYFENMGHDLPQEVFDPLVAALVSTFERSLPAGGGNHI
jgi:pimeloyl-ACP methyl ester carboxylesterase